MRWGHIWLITGVVAVLCFISASSKRKNLELGSLGLVRGSRRMGGKMTSQSAGNSAFDNSLATGEEIVAATNNVPKDVLLSTSKEASDTKPEGSKQSASSLGRATPPVPSDSSVDSVDLWTTTSRPLPKHNRSRTVRRRAPRSPIDVGDHRHHLPQADWDEPMLHIHVINQFLSFDTQWAFSRRENKGVRLDDCRPRHFASKLIASLSSLILGDDNAAGRSHIGAAQANRTSRRFGISFGTRFSPTLHKTMNIGEADDSNTMSRSNGRASPNRTCFTYATVDKGPFTSESQSNRRHLSFSRDNVGYRHIEQSDSLSDESLPMLHRIVMVMDAMTKLRTRSAVSSSTVSIRRPIHLVVLVVVHLPARSAAHIDAAVTQKLKRWSRLISAFIRSHGIGNASSQDRVEVIVLPSVVCNGGMHSPHSVVAFLDSDSSLHSADNNTCPAVDSCDNIERDGRDDILCRQGSKDGCCTLHYWSVIGWRDVRLPPPPPTVHNDSSSLLHKHEQMAHSSVADEFARAILFDAMQRLIPHTM